MKHKPTLKQKVEEAKNEAKARVARGQNAPALLVNYTDRGRKLVKFFGDTPLEKIDTPMIRRFVDWLTTEEGNSFSSALAFLSMLSVILKTAYDDGLIKRMPSFPRKGQKPSPRPAFSKTDYKTLLTVLKQVEAGKPAIKFHGNVVDWELRAIVTFMVNSFFRPGDLFKIQNKHVVIVPEAADGPEYLRIDAPSSKGHEAPIITMPVAAMIYRRVLGNHKAAGFGRDDDYVFLPARRNRRYAYEIVRRQFRLVLVHAKLEKSVKGVDHSLYSLRHTALTFRLLNAKELDLVTLARAARTSVDMIDRYYASTLTAEMNRDKLHSFRRPTRFLTDGKSSSAAQAKDRKGAAV